MAKIIGVYDSLQEVRDAISRLEEIGTDASRLMIIGPEVVNRSGLKTSMLLGGSVGLAVSFIMPGGGHLLWGGHMARALILHTMRITGTAIASGAVAGGTLELLSRIGLDRRAVQEAKEVIDNGQYALALKDGWAAVQRSRDFLGRYRTGPDPRLIEIVRRHGYEHQSFLSLYDGMKVWYAAQNESAVVYRQVGRVALVTGAPLAARENLKEVTLEFLDYCRVENLDCLMLPIGEEFAEIAKSCGMALLGVGESGYFKLPEWRPLGDRGKKVRSGVNQATKAGIRIERYEPGAGTDPEIRAAIEKLCQDWIDTREVDALGWLLELDPFYLSNHKRYFLARNLDGEIEGLLACAPIPARNGWYLEDLIKRAGAERGVSELLVVEALRYLSSEGAEIATLATSPLAGIDSSKMRGQFRLLARILVLIYRNLDTFYHFKSLHRFKSKFAPSFVEAEYLAVYPPRITPPIIAAQKGALDPAGFTTFRVSQSDTPWQLIGIAPVRHPNMTPS